MKAFIISEHGGTNRLCLTDLPRPALRPDGVLLRVKAVALNHLDIWVRKGVPGHAFPLPIIPGCDAAGVVEEVGALVANVKVGERVALMPGIANANSFEALSGMDHLARDYGIFGETRNGACAEYLDVPAGNLLPIPDNMSFTDAASMPLTFLTAWSMLARRCEIRPGDSVLIHAAGSGVSVACIQIAKLWGAAPIIVTAGDDTKLARAKALGADVGVNYRRDDFLTVSRAETGKRGVDIVVDHVGAETLARSLACLAKGGRLVTCGSTSGGEAAVNLRQVFFKSLSILGSTMGPKSDLIAVWKLIAAGKLKAVVDRVFPIRELAAAHDYLESRRAFGKVVLDAEQW